MKAVLTYDPPNYRIILTPESEDEAANLLHSADSHPPITTEFRRTAYSKYDALEIRRHKS